MADPTYPLFPICAFLSLVLVVIPLPWHVQSWNSGTCLFMFWVGLSALNFFINSLIWHGNIFDSLPIWCDISSHIIVAAAVGIPASSLCINRRLYSIAACKTVNITIAHKRRAVMTDLFIGLGLPILQLPLQFIVQGHRYDIWEDVGCYPNSVNTLAAYPLTLVWPNVICLISGTYCILTLRQFMKRRAQFNQFLSLHTPMSVSRYFRLMALASCELLFNTPISSYGLYLNIIRPVYPWISWSDIHFDFWNVQKIPSALWRLSPALTSNLELTRWSIVLCAVIFFVFFGFADEARKNYKLAYWTLAKRFGILPPSPTPNSGKAHQRLNAYGNLDELKRPNLNPSPTSTVELTSNFQKRTSISLSLASTFVAKSNYSGTIHMPPTSPNFKAGDIPRSPPPLANVDGDY